MIANQKTDKEYCIEIRNLLQEVGEDRYVHLFDFFVEELELEDKSSAYLKIKEIYGGMGSFNDLVLHRDGIPLQEENDRLAELRLGLWENVAQHIEQQQEQQKMEADLSNKKMNDLLQNALDNYTQTQCPCAFPRFIQLVSIDCFDSRNSFSSYETEALIELVKPHYDTVTIANKEENHAERWTCKTCASEFEYLWSDVSIAISRTTLKPISIKAKMVGLPAEKTIPLFNGLLGYSFPSKDKIIGVTYEEFEHYILEKTDTEQEVKQQVNRAEEEAQNTSDSTDSQKATINVTKKRKKRKRPFLTALMIFCALFGISFTLYIDYLDSTIGRGVLTMSLTAMTAGILFESLRLTKSPLLVFKAYAATFFAAFLVFITRFTNRLMIGAMVQFWPQILLLVYGIFMGFSVDSNRSTNFNRPFSMLLSLSFLYWSLEKFQTDNILWICNLIFAGIFFIFVLLTLYQKASISHKGRLLLSLVGMSILFLLAIDYFISLRELTIYSDSTKMEVLKYSLQYFLMGICTIFLFVNVGPLLLHMMQLKNDRKNIYFQNMVRISKIDLIKRFKDNHKERALTVFIAVISLLIYGINYSVHFLPMQALIWVVITVSQIGKEYFYGRIIEY